MTKTHEGALPSQSIFQVIMSRTIAHLMVGTNWVVSQAVVVVLTTEYWSDKIGQWVGREQSISFN